MKLKSFFMIIATAGLLLSCNNEQKPGEVIGKSNVKAENGLMTPEILYSFGRIGSVEVSPDKSKILYQVTYVDIKQNKTNPELFVMNADGSDKKQLTVTNARESNPQWISGGEKIAFLSDESGTSQIWTMNSNGSGMKKITDVEEGINGFIFSPGNKKVLFIKNVKVGETTKDKYPDLPEASGRVVDNLMYKHWDSWVEEVPHTFVADFNGDELSNSIDLLQAWSPDGKTVAYTSRKKTGKEYAVSTNSDIYFYDVESGKTTNMTEGMMGYDVNPQFSPDGSKLAWQSMERDGYEADKNRLFVMDLASGNKTYVTENFDYNTDAFVWNTDNKTIYLVSCVEAKTQLFSADIESKLISPITKGKHDYASVAPGNGKLFAKRHSMSQPDEIYSVNLANGQATEISFENKHILEQLTMGETEERWITTTDGKQMLTWVVYPPDFDSTKKYPALLYCQGGPQSTVSQFWSYRWNLQMMAANGYIVVAPNRRTKHERLSFSHRCVGERTVCGRNPLGLHRCKLWRIFRLLACRKSRRTLQGVPGTCGDLQSGSAVSGNGGDVVRQLGYGRTVLGQIKCCSAENICYFTASFCG